MKARPILFSGPMVRAILDGRKSQTRRVMKPQPFPAYEGGPLVMGQADCPYGEIDDRLWVRETFIARAEPGKAWYRATTEQHAVHAVRWTPSIFMPRSLSRITLEVLGVRVERVQDITFVDIRAEGVECPEHDFPSGYCCSECPSLRSAFAELWDSINGKRTPWASNPWVWVIDFKRCDAKERAA